MDGKQMWRCAGVRVLAILAAALLTGGLQIASASGQAGASEAEDGAAPLFASQCASCHGRDLGGGEFGPALRSEGFRAKWGAKPLELQRYIRTSMPPARPGALADREYPAMQRYLFRQNGLPEAGLDAASETSQIVPESFHVGYNAPRQGAFDDSFSRAAIERRRNLLASLSTVTDEKLREGPAEDWLHWRGDYAMRSFSSLTKISVANVSRLRAVWSWSLPVGANGIAPLVHDGVLFVNSANEVQALDAASGTLLWGYARELPQAFNNSTYTRQRNIAIGGDKVFVATGDRHLVALDMRTGKPVWDSEVVGPAEPGLMLIAGPMVVGNRVIQTTATGPACTDGCSIVGFDRDTGSKVWEVRTIAPAGTPAGRTWNGAAAGHRYGGGVWISGSHDPDLNLVYFGVGQTYSIGTLLRPRQKIAGEAESSDALYTDSTLAIDPQTGRIVWHHQHLSRDVWDQDEVFERTLVDLPTKQGLRKLLVTTGKLGIIDILDRKTGAYVSSIDLGFQNLVESINPRTGKRKIRPGMDPVADKPMAMCPGVTGARNWMTTAWDATSGTMFFPLLDSCSDIVWLAHMSDADKTIMGMRFDGFDLAWRERPRQGGDGNFGELAAIGLPGGQKRWTIRQRAPFMSSLLATAGGVLFTGDRDRIFAARDMSNGDLLWSTRLNAIPNSSPITFMADGHQYVAVVTGGGTQIDLLTRAYTPEIEAGTPATTLWVFGLDGAN